PAVTCPECPVRFLVGSTSTPAGALYTLPLHDALPILSVEERTRGNRIGARSQIVQAVRPHGDEPRLDHVPSGVGRDDMIVDVNGDRKSTRLNSSHVKISYAVFCLKTKTTNSSRTPARR